MKRPMPGSTSQSKGSDFLNVKLIVMTGASGAGMGDESWIWNWKVPLLGCSRRLRITSWRDAEPAMEHQTEEGEAQFDF